MMEAHQPTLELDLFTELTTTNFVLMLVSIQLLTIQSQQRDLME